MNRKIYRFVKKTLNCNNINKQLNQSKIYMSKIIRQLTSKIISFWEK